MSRKRRRRKAAKAKRTRRRTFKGATQRARHEARFVKRLVGPSFFKRVAGEAVDPRKVIFYGGPFGPSRTRLRRKWRRTKEAIPGFGRLYVAKWHYDPRRHIICAKRRIKREVLFANERIGKGRGGPKRRVWDNTSGVRC